MVVGAIFALLSAIVLANNSRFGSVIVLQNLAHDIALTIREAQVYGISVRRYETGTFNVAYGMHFIEGISSYELFADLNQDGIWESDETVREMSVAGGYRLENICTAAETCGFARADVIFKRPEPDACISVGGTISVETTPEWRCTSTTNQRMSIDVKSNRGDTITIVVEKSGQISVQ